MDLKFKGTKWVGNICQKFEAICHDVDDFVTQDTVKYVENQVQTVGDSVKRFYSDVVLDLLPSSTVKPGKHEAQALSPRQNNTIGTQVRSTIACEEKPAYADINQSSVEEYPTDLLKNIPEQGIDQTSVDRVRQAEDANALKDKKFDIVLEENDTQEGLVDKKFNIVVEANDTEEKVIDKRSHIVVEENDTKKEPSRLESLDLIFPENKNLPEASLLSETIDEKNGILAEVPPATSVCSTPKDKIACISFLDEVECVSDISSMLTPSEMGSSVVSSENKTAEVELISSSSSLSTETYSVSEFTHENVTPYEENIYDNPVGAIGYVSDLSDAILSSQPFRILCCDNKVADMGLALSSSALSVESKDVDTSKTDDAASLAGSSGNRQEYCYECTQLEVSMSSLEIGEADNNRVDIDDPSMETIELSKANLDESCVVVDSKLLYAVSCRAQRHRSYKKILLDAFASKKRIRKEYEQLGILYGDIDSESSQQPPQNLLLPSSSLDSEKSPSQDLCDPEWELL